MATSPRLALILFLSAMLLGSVGCNRGDQPELGKARGTVTLDGKPLAGVIIRFHPQTGRAGTATTDSDGKYDLVYTYGVNGAKVGPNTVSFAWPDGEAGGSPIPGKYAGESELKVEVKAGKNTFDFPLESE
ncbi:MAG: hypothetical protein ABIK89_17525 [Planctomycetota bacterium]